MLSLNDYNKLQELKEQLANALGMPEGFEFNDSQLKEIFREVESYPKSKRTIAVWQNIVSRKTGVRRFRLFEALEFSEIDYIHEQIQELLNRK